MFALRDTKAAETTLEPDYRPEITQLRKHAKKNVPEVPHVDHLDEVIPALQDFRNTGVLVTNPWGKQKNQFSSIQGISVNNRRTTPEKSQDIEELLRSGLVEGENPNFEEKEFKQFTEQILELIKLKKSLTGLSEKEIEIVASTYWTNGGGIHTHSHEISIVTTFRKPGTIYYNSDTLENGCETADTKSGIAREGEVLVFRNPGVRHVAGLKPPSEEWTRGLHHRRAALGDVYKANDGIAGFKTVPGRFFVLISGMPKKLLK